MNGISFVADTNFLLYVLEGREEVEAYLDYRCAISAISEIELLGWHKITDSEKVRISALLDACVLIEITNTIRKRAILLRQKHRIKTADAIVVATAQELGLPLLTADKALAKLQGVESILLA